MICDVWKCSGTGLVLPVSASHALVSPLQQQQIFLLLLKTQHFPPKHKKNQTEPSGGNTDPHLKHVSNLLRCFHGERPSKWR